MRAEELKGHLDALLLAALEGGPRHGYAVIEALRQATGGRLDLPTGTIYPALHRLGAAGLSTGAWAGVARRQRREYPPAPPRGPGLPPPSAGITVRQAAPARPDASASPRSPPPC